MTFELTFPSGVIAHCATTYKVNGLNRFTAFAERGSFGMEPAYNYTGTAAGGATARRSRSTRSTSSPRRWTTSRGASRPANATRVPGEEGLRDVRMLMAIYEAARTGRAVKVG